MSNGNDETWARDMLLRIQQGAEKARIRRDNLALAVDELAAGFSLLGRSRWRPARRTEGRVDSKAPALRLGDRTEDVQDLIRYETNVNLLSAADQLRGFAVLLRAETSLMGAVTVSRGVFEACVWASALVDPSRTTEERVQRALTRRLARLSAGVRLNKILSDAAVQGPRDDGTDPVLSHEAPVDDDQHGSGRDAQQDIDDILHLADACGWKVIQGQRTPSIGSRLSVDWLSENLEHAIGIESYSWTSGSSMSHGEHPADTASWVELAQSIGSAPAWLMQTWSTGIWAGPRLFLASWAEYSGRNELPEEFAVFAQRFWDRG